MGSIMLRHRKKTLMHGVLIVTIDEIDEIEQGIEDRVRTWKTIMHRAKQCPPWQPQGCRLYVSVDLDNVRVANTRIVQALSNPRWFQSFRIYCAYEVSDIKFTIRDENFVTSTLIGIASMSVDILMSGRRVKRWLPMMNEKYKPVGSQIHVSLQFFHVTRDPRWSKGIQAPDDERRGCKVSLYQDTHVAEDTIPELKLSQGMIYKPGRCWEDIFDAVINAKHLIYIAGWSINTKITLIRDPRRSEKHGELAGITLGELLQRKALETGMRVLVLVWEDATSKMWLYPRFNQTSRTTGTDDVDTVAYFKNSKVRCFQCCRTPDRGKGLIEGVQSSFVSKHNQRTIVVDSEVNNSGEKRTLVCFLGGIDLCQGRYDTQDHSLFRTLNTAHLTDFHQPNFRGSSIKKGGPREPWHDIHCRVEGSAAWDVLFNFEQRWRKEVGKREGWGFLYTMRDFSERLLQPEVATSSTEDNENWSVQIFRSIDAGALVGFPSDPIKSPHIGLVYDKGSIFDRSIHDGYVNAIRRAKEFIYIENQYFIGSSYGWKPEQDAAALHLIPKELSLKIVSKIEAGERFSVYIVIPMWPEGVPESAAVQDILYHQRKTMEMMYTDIAAAIERKQLGEHPTDYLSFFCLGNREVLTGGEYLSPETPEPDSNYFRAKLNRRFMIYVHSKMMIVDDEYIIIGSADINQRSMDGGINTEIAMGAFQPDHLAIEQPARGHIFGFRMSLWCEHLRQVQESFKFPETIECMREIRRISEHNWDMYLSESYGQGLPSHLLRYPLNVTGDGNISAIPGVECFPDTKASVFGSNSSNHSVHPILVTDMFNVR